MKGKVELGIWGKRIYSALDKYKYVFIVILAGVLLLMIPTFESGEAEAPQQAGEGDSFDLEAMERKLARALSEVEGAGEVTVVLTVRSGTRQILAQDSVTSQTAGEHEGTLSTVVVSRGSGVQETVPIQTVSPQFQGALVVCPGGGDPAVRLKLMEAVSALTGLGSDKISICKGN